MSSFSIGQQVGALAIVVAVATGAGIAIGILFGFTFPSMQCFKFKGYRLNPIIKVMQIPSLIMMIILGCIARNLFGKVMDAYPTLWTSYIRSICLCLLLIRGGLQIQFKGKGLMVVFLSFVPQIFEAVTIALIASGLFNMPMTLCFALAFTIACISPSVMVPGLIVLNEKGYGRQKGIVSSLIAAGTFDDIICIICFGICKTIAYNDYDMSGGKSLGLSIGILFLENLAGLAVGVIMGLASWFFNFMPKAQWVMNLKAFYCVACSIGFVIAGEKSTFTNSKYIAGLSLGYTCYRVWGEDKPTKETGWFWWAIQPIFFGSVGAALVFKTIRNSDIGNGIICIICGLIVRLFIVQVVAYFPRGKYTVKERAFMSFAWLPKATVQAALSAVILNDGKSAKNAEMQEYGNIIQTVSIFSIVICAPIGAVLISTFGPLFLPYTDPNPPAQKIDTENDPALEGDDKDEIKIGTKDEQEDGDLPASGPSDVDFKPKKGHHAPPTKGMNSSRQLIEDIDTIYNESEQQIPEEEEEKADIDLYSSPQKLRLDF